MTLDPKTVAVLVVLGALLFVGCCSRIPVIGPFVVAAALVGAFAGVAGFALAQGLV